MVEKFFSIFFVILLSVPVALWLVGDMHGNGDNTVRQGFPRPEATLWLDRGYYQAVEGWFQDSLPVRKPLKVFHNWLNYNLFSATSDTTVHIGIQGWLFPRMTTADRLGPMVARQTGHRLFLDLHAVEKMIAATGRQFLFTVIPGKAGMYPEYVDSGDTGAPSLVYQALLDANERNPLTGFISLDPALKKAKLSGIDIYHKRSRLWTCAGGAAAAEQILTFQELTQPASKIHSAVACPPPDNNLYRLLLGEEPQEKSTLR